MYTNSKGEIRYTDREKYDYHAKCANSGKGAEGNKLTMLQRHRHAVLAEKYRKRLSRFMNGVEYGKEIACAPKGRKK